MNTSLVISVLLVLALTSCKKEKFIPAPLVNNAPSAMAGASFYIVLPSDSAILEGDFDDAPYDTVRFNWRTISAPGPVAIARPDLLKTVARNLVKGLYEFELTVTDQGGLTDRDTFSLNVVEPFVVLSNEIVFNNMGWSFPWYPVLEVRNIIRYPPISKVFIQRDFDPTWVEVKYVSDTSVSNQYDYFIETRPDGGGMYRYGSMYINYYGKDTDDSPNIKVQF